MNEKNAICALTFSIMTGWTCDKGSESYAYGLDCSICFCSKA
jgi:hypothetical protein